MVISLESLRVSRRTLVTSGGRLKTSQKALYARSRPVFYAAEKRLRTDRQTQRLYLSRDFNGTRSATMILVRRAQSIDRYSHLQVRWGRSGRGGGRCASWRGLMFCLSEAVVISSADGRTDVRRTARLAVLLAWPSVTDCRPSASFNPSQSSYLSSLHSDIE